MLEAVQKRVQYEDAVWGYMETAIRDAALKYQTQPIEAFGSEVPVKFSIQELEALVLKTAEKKEPNEVSSIPNCTHTDVNAHTDVTDLLYSLTTIVLI